MAQTKIKSKQLDLSGVPHLIATRTTDLTIADNTSTTITSYDTVTDDGGNFNNTTGVFTVPEDGTYLIMGEVRWLNLTAGKRYITTAGGGRGEFYMPSTNSFSTITSVSMNGYTAGGSISAVATQITGISRDITSVSFNIVKVT